MLGQLAREAALYTLVMGLVATTLGHLAAEAISIRLEVIAFVQQAHRKLVVVAALSLV